MASVTPASVIQYEVTSNAFQPNHKTIQQQGFSRFNNLDGLDSILCQKPVRLEPFPDFTRNLYGQWRLLGMILAYAFAYLTARPLLDYAVKRKISELLIFLLFAIVMAAPSSILFYVFGNTGAQLPVCAPTNAYKLLSFTPYWPMVLILTAGSGLCVLNFYLVRKLKADEGIEQVSQ